MPSLFCTVSRISIASCYAFSLTDMPRGRYIVRVNGAGITATRPVLIK